MPRRLSQLAILKLFLDGYYVLLSSSARNLGIYFDADSSVRRPTDVVVSCCSAVRRQLRSIHRYVTDL